MCSTRWFTFISKRPATSPNISCFFSKSSGVTYLSFASQLLTTASNSSTASIRGCAIRLPRFNTRVAARLADHRGDAGLDLDDVLRHLLRCPLTFAGRPPPAHLGRLDRLSKRGAGLRQRCSQLVRCCHDASSPASVLPSVYAVRPQPSRAAPSTSLEGTRRMPRMELRSLGRTGVQVSSLCLGCMMFGRRTEPEESYAIIDRALDAGINFLDTANVYAHGRSEEITGEALKRNGRRHQVVPRDQGAWLDGRRGPERARQQPPPTSSSSARPASAASRPTTSTSTSSTVPSPTFPSTRRCAPSTTSFAPARFATSAPAPFASWEIVESLWVSKELGLNRVVCEQPPYNLLDRRAERELLPMTQTFGIGVIPWGPIGGGLLAGPVSPRRAPARGRSLRHEPAAAPPPHRRGVRRHRGP